MDHLEMELSEKGTVPGGRGASVIYLIDSIDHPSNSRPANFVSEFSVIVRVPVRDWGTSLTPWPARSPWRGQPDFGGKAGEMLDELVHEVPGFEARCGLSPASRAICGYSLGGLFSLYAFVRTDLFKGCGCVSGSVWYEGWVPWLRGQDLDLRGRFAYLSLGSREKNARQPILRTVEDNMAACADMLREHGCEVEYVVGPGTHFQHERERIDAAILALSHHLA